MMNTRRVFIMQSLTGASALAALGLAATASAEAPVAVVDTDPQAMALGYKTDGSKTDVKKYPSYAANQSCSACVLFQGKPKDMTASCAIFGNKLVAQKGWCSAWAKKAA